MGIGLVSACGMGVNGKTRRLHGVAVRAIPATFLVLEKDASEPGSMAQPMIPKRTGSSRPIEMI